MSREDLIKRLVDRTLLARRNAGWLVAPVVCLFSVAPKPARRDERPSATRLKS